MLKSVVCYQATHPNDPQAAYAIMAIRGELESLEISVRHQAMVAEQQRLKDSVDRLAKPHRLLWWTFVVTSLTLIVCVIGYWDQIVRLIRALIP